MKVGVVGAGQMGSGIAHVAALASHDVLLFDNIAGVADQAVTNIHANLTRQAAREMIVESSVKPALDHIQVVDSMADLGACDLVIEAATENEEVKISIYQELCPLLGPDTVLATNTSSISVTRLAAATDRQQSGQGAATAAAAATATPAGTKQSRHSTSYVSKGKPRKA